MQIWWEYLLTMQQFFQARDQGWNRVNCLHCICTRMFMSCNFLSWLQQLWCNKSIWFTSMTIHPPITNTVFLALIPILFPQCYDRSKFYFLVWIWCRIPDNISNPVIYNLNISYYPIYILRQYIVLIKYIIVKLYNS